MYVYTNHACTLRKAIIYLREEKGRATLTAIELARVELMIRPLQVDI